FETTKEGFSLELLKRRDVILRISAMVLAGIEAVFLKKIILMSSFEISFILWCFGGLLFSLLIFLLSKPTVQATKQTKSWYKFFILALCLGLMQLSTNYVFSKLNVGLSLALFQLSTIVNLFLGYKIFKETDILKKFIGIVIMLIGSVLILMLNN
ncbi:MAG: DMT family transporter, partial [bacterium]|nr:DMT family transporter [bacterium]